jgi:hypothetical protein
MAASRGVQLSTIDGASNWAVCSAGEAPRFADATLSLSHIGRRFLPRTVQAGERTSPMLVSSTHCRYATSCRGSENCGISPARRRP